MSAFKSLWETYSNEVEVLTQNAQEKRLKLGEAKNHLFALFKARYQFARKFKGIRAQYNEPSLRGYSEMTRLFLAYTALEVLVEAIDASNNGNIADYKREKQPAYIQNQKSGDYALYNRIKLLGSKKLTEQFRKILTRKDKIIAKTTPFLHKNVDGKLQSFANNFLGESNLMIVAYAFRVIVAHGSLSPTDIPIVKKKKIKAFRKLSKLLLKECQRCFEKWLDEAFEGKIYENFNDLKKCMAEKQKNPR